MFEFIVPIIVSLGIGAFSRRRHFLAPGTIQELKSLITTFFLPFIAFQMFSEVKLELSTLALVFLYVGVMAATLVTGFLVRRLFGEYGKYSPFIISSAEGGMMGIGLLPMIYGQESLPFLAPFELGQALFFFIVFLAVLNSVVTSGEENSQKESFWKKAGKIVKNIVTMPVFSGIIAGILYQVTGLGKLLASNGGADSLYAAIDVFSALIMPLILITIGYDLTFDREIMKPVLKVSAARLVIMGFWFAAACLVLRAMGIEENMYYYALALECSLPPAFPIAAYLNEEKHQRYINAMIGVYVVVTLVFALGFKIFLA